MSSTHNPDNESCPLNDPETACNPVLSGLPCSCEESQAPDPRERLRTTFNELPRFGEDADNVLMPMQSGEWVRLEDVADMLGFELEYGFFGPAT